MSIKQNGGVFGRNPAFNDVAVSGGLTVSGEASVSDLLIAPEKIGSYAREIDTFNSTDAVAGGTGFFGYSFKWNNNSARILAIRENDDRGGLGLGLYSSSAWFATPTLGLQLLPNSDVKVNTGNLVIGTSGNGINFSATAGTGTSELFDDYEEGTWTPAFSAEFTTAPTVTSAQYTKVGRQVTVTMLATDGVVTAGGSITGLPFASNASQGAGAYGGNSDTTESLQGTVGQSASSITNIPARTLTGDTWQITATYFT